MQMQWIIQIFLCCDFKYSIISVLFIGDECPEKQILNSEFSNIFIRLSNLTESYL